MDSEQIAWIVASGAGGALLSVVGSWAKSQIERIGSVEQREEQRDERHTERTMDQVSDLANLKARVDLLMEERGKCDVLAERAARLEAFQSWAEPLLEKAVEGLQQAVAFEARFEERLVTLFKGFDAMTKRIERFIPHNAG
jgi:hypothetical protein